MAFLDHAADLALTEPCHLSEAFLSHDRHRDHHDVLVLVHFFAPCYTAKHYSPGTAGYTRFRGLSLTSASGREHMSSSLAERIRIIREVETSGRA